MLQQALFHIIPAVIDKVEHEALPGGTTALKIHIHRVHSERKMVLVLTDVRESSDVSFTSNFDPVTGGHRL